MQSCRDGLAAELLDLVAEVAGLLRASEDRRGEFAANEVQPGGEVGDALVGWYRQGWFDGCLRGVERA